jgi:hypothetical protein
MSEARLLLKGKLGELSREYLILKNEGTSILEQLSKKLNLHLCDKKIENVKMEEVNALTNRLNSIHEEITEIKERIKEIEEELK